MMFFWNSLRFKSKDPQTRRKAIESLNLETETTSQVFEVLTTAARDEDPGVRSAAAKALGGTQHDRAVELVIPLLWDINLEVRQAAAEALGQLGDFRATGPLTRALKDPHAPVRASAAAALRSLGWQPQSGEEQAMFEVALGHAQTAAFKG